MVIGVYAAIRTGLFTPDKAFEVVVRKQIASLKAPTDIVVRLVTEEVLKICQEGVAQVNAGTGSFSLGTALHRHVMFLRTKSTALFTRLQGCQQLYTNLFPWFHFESNTACLPSTFLFSLSLSPCM